jgi:hypothetical protein
MLEIRDSKCRSCLHTEMEIFVSMLNIYGRASNIILNPLHAELNPIRHLLASVGAHHVVHVSRVRVNLCAVLNFSFCGVAA